MRQTGSHKIVPFGGGWGKGIWLLFFCLIFSMALHGQPQADSLTIKNESQRLGINTFSFGTVADDRYVFHQNHQLKINLGQYAIYNRALSTRRFITQNLWSGVFHRWQFSRRWSLDNEAWQYSYLANETRQAQAMSRIRFLASQNQFSSLFFRLGLGVMNDKRLQFNNMGPMAEAGLDWNQQSKDTLLLFKAQAEAMIANISPRVNQKLLGQMQVSRIFPEAGLLGAECGYQHRKVEDFLGADIQSILSDSLFARVKMKYSPARGLIFSSENEYTIPNRSFLYRNVESGKETRNVFYKQHEWQSMNRLQYQNDRIKAGFTLELRQRTRDYGIKKRFSPSDPDYFIQQNLYEQRLKEEQIKDIQEQFITYSTDWRWKMNSRHLIRGATVAQLLRVDTRSELNTQDRDEILYSTELAHEWQWRPSFTLINKFSGSWRHLIFIEASQSSENFIDRILRWEPGFRLRLPRFTWSGTSGIWATYQVRDFESVADRNRSNRVLIFNQQAEYRLDHRWKLMLDFLRRENRLSLFNWERFSESPIDTVVIYDVSFRPQFQWNTSVNEWAFQLGYRIFWQVRKNRASLLDPAVGSRLIYLQNYIIQQGPQVKLVWNKTHRLRLQAEFWFQWSSQFFRYQKTDEIYLGTNYTFENLAFKDNRLLPYFQFSASWRLHR